MRLSRPALIRLSYARIKGITEDTEQDICEILMHQESVDYTHHEEKITFTNMDLTFEESDYEHDADI